MTHSTLKITFCIAVCLIMLLAPFTLKIAPDGIAYAMGSGGGRGSDGTPRRYASPEKTRWAGYTVKKSGENGGRHDTRTTHKVPEPSTMILVGGGLAGLAIFKRKFKN